MTPLPTSSVVQFGDPTAPTADQRRSSNSGIKALTLLLGVPAALAIGAVVIMDTFYLAGSGENGFGWGIGIVGGLIGGAMVGGLLPAAAIIYKEGESAALAVLALILFIPAFIVSGIAASGFAFLATLDFSTATHPRETVNFSREPRQLDTIDNERQDFLETAMPHGPLVATGQQILNQTGNCTRFRFDWERNGCDRLDDLQRERAARIECEEGARGPNKCGLTHRHNKQNVSQKQFGEWITPEQRAQHRAISAWVSAYLIVSAAAALGLVTGYCLYLLQNVKSEAPAPPTAIAPPPNGQANLIQQTFDAWAEQCLQPAAGVTVPADLLYRHHVAFADWTKGRAHAGVETFGAAMSGPLRKLGAVRTEIGKNRDTAYAGLEIRTNGLSGQILAQLGTQAAIA